MRFHVGFSLMSALGGDSWEGSALVEPDCQPAPSEVGEPCLSPRLDQPELRFREGHLTPDLILALFQQVKPSQHFAVPSRHSHEDSEHQLPQFLVRKLMLGVGRFVRKRIGCVHLYAMRPCVSEAADFGCNVPLDDYAEIGGKRFRLAKVTVLDAAQHSQENVVDLVANPLSP
jgi:hypothetical protein